MAFKELTIINQEAKQDNIDSRYNRDRLMYLKGQKAAKMEQSREECVESIDSLRDTQMFNMGYSYGSETI